MDCAIAYGLGMDWVNPEFQSSWRTHIETRGYAGAWLSDHVFSTGGGLVPEFTTSLDVVYHYIEQMLKADGIVLNRDPSGVGAEVSCWRLSLKRYQFPLGKGYHSCETIALVLALIDALVQRIDGE